MRKFFAFILLAFLFSSEYVIGQEVIIGKEEFQFTWPDIPIRTGEGYDFNYNQMIYQQPWIHAEGEIEKIAFYYSGGTPVTYDIVVYMGHTSKNEFLNNDDWIPVEDLTLVFDGQYTVSDTLGWSEIDLDIPFNYNNHDNLVIAIDRNSKTDADGIFYSTIIDDDNGTRKTYSEYYNIDPAEPVFYDCIDIHNKTPRLKLTGNLEISDYLYIYGTKYKDISTTPGTQDSVYVETNMPDFSVESNQSWLGVEKDLNNEKIMATVNATTSTLSVLERTSSVIAEYGLLCDTIWYTQYKYEPFIIENKSFLFCDFDNDLDLDIVGDFPHFTENDGAGNFTDSYQEYEKGGTSFWSDYDNDGDFDLIVYGDAYGDYYTYILRNDDTTFNQITDDIVPFQSIYHSHCFFSNPWCDYDNDGLKDLVIAGIDSLGDSKTMLYKNKGNDKFIDSEIDLRGSYEGYVTWGDYNSDGYSDLFVCGTDINGNSRSSIYKNNKEGEFFLIDLINSGGIWHNSIDPGDYDADGDMDLLITVNNNEGLLKIYQNDVNDYFETLIVDTVEATVAKWIDLNNDGQLDIIAFDNQENRLRIYINNGNNDYSKYSKSFDIHHFAMMNVGDYDKDGDCDFLLRGLYSENIYLFRNNSNIANHKPGIPDGLNERRKGSETYLSWNPSTDLETPQKSLSYNVRIGSSPDAYDILAPHADINTGFIQFPQRGNASIDTFKIIKDLPPGKYYWSVQAVDYMFAGSEFSPEQSFEVLPPFSKNDTVVPYWFKGSSAFGDYDNDGDYDLMIFGTLSDASGSMTKLYKNNGDSSFVEVEYNFEGVIDGNIEFGDYNKDHLIDILLTGVNKNGEAVANIYRNNGNDIFHRVKEIIVDDGYRCLGCWTDLNNDGDLDIIVSSDANTKYYQNDNNDNFVLTEIPVNEMGSDILKIADFDNDGDMDIFRTGWKVGSRLSYLSINENNDSFSSNDLDIYIIDGTCDVGDYNNDGYADLLLSGGDTLGYRYTKIFKNLGNYQFEEIETSIRYVSEGDASWGDFDNDNDLDVVVGGYSGGVILKVYENKGNNDFEEIFNDTFDQFNQYTGFTIWGDYNNDQNLDFIRNGMLYSNNLNVKKAPLMAPQNLSESIDGFSVSLSWEKIIDQQNDDCYTYNLRVGTTSGGIDIISPMADVETGFRRVMSMGNVQKNNAWAINNLQTGQTYYWSVQAIDHSYRGGPWAEEQSFTMPSLFADFVSDTVCEGAETHFTDLSQSPDEDIVSWEWSFGDGGVSSEQNPAYTYTTSGTFNVSLTINTATHTQTVTKEVIVYPTPIADFGFEIISLGQHTPFTNLTDTNNAVISSWQWDFGDGSTYNDAFPEFHKYSETGTYNVTLTVESNNGCSSTITKKVDVCLEALPKPDLYAKGPTVNYLACSNDSASYYKWYTNGELIEGADKYIYVASKSYGTYHVEISSDGLCYTPSDPVNIGLTDIDNPDPFANLKIYPNPTPGVFTIEMNNQLYGELITRIFNISAVEILNIKFDKSTRHFKAQVDLSGQGRGIYIISLMIDKYKTERKLIVE